MTTMPSVAEFMHKHHVLGKRFCSKTNRIFLYFFTCHHCLNILICSFKCTGKSYSICMTVEDDYDERAFVKQPYVLHSIKFHNVCLCLSLYMLELSLELYILHEGTNIRVSTQSQFQPYFKLHSRFLQFRKFRLVILSTRCVMFTSFKPCLHFVGR